MQRLFSSFPSDRPGLGLLLLRGVAGIVLARQGVLSFIDLSLSSDRWQMIGQLLMSLVLILGSLLLILGLLTPIAGIVLAISKILIGISWLATSQIQFDTQSNGLQPFLMATITAALALIGPGAFSLDAKLYGRRRIAIPQR